MNVAPHSPKPRLEGDLRAIQGSLRAAPGAREVYTFSGEDLLSMLAQVSSDARRLLVHSPRHLHDDPSGRAAAVIEGQGVRVSLEPADLRALFGQIGQRYRRRLLAAWGRTQGKAQDAEARRRNLAGADAAPRPWTVLQFENRFGRTPREFADAHPLTSSHSYLPPATTVFPELGCALRYVSPLRVADPELTDDDVDTQEWGTALVSSDEVVDGYMTPLAYTVLQNGKLSLGSGGHSARFAALLAGKPMLCFVPQAAIKELP